MPAPPVTITVPPLVISLPTAPRTFAPTIVTATHPAPKRKRARSDSPVANDELRDPYGATP